MVHRIQDTWDMVRAATKTTGCDTIALAIAKATRHDENAPKEKHVATLVRAASRPGLDLAYTAHRLSKRLRASHDWRPVLKTIYLIHTLARRASPQFSRVFAADNTDEIFALAHMSTGVGHPTPSRIAVMPFIRAYAAFVEAKLEYFMSASFDYEAHSRCGGRNGDEEQPCERTENPFGTLEAPQAIEAVGKLQKLMGSAIACTPSREVSGFPIVVTSLSAIIRESFTIQAYLMRATLHLVDTFSGMELEDAERALYLYQVQGGELHTRQQRFYALGRDIVGEDHGQPELADLPEALGETMKNRIAQLKSPEQHPAVTSPHQHDVDYEVTSLLRSPTSPSPQPRTQPQPQPEKDVDLDADAEPAPAPEPVTTTDSPGAWRPGDPAAT
jgi:hypothetical protein